MDRQMQPSGKGFVRRLAVLLGSAALLLPLAAEPVRQHTSAAALYLLTMAATTMATPAQAQTAPRITSIELVGDANPLTTVTELKWRVTFNQTVQNQTATFNWQVSGAGVSSVTVTQRRIDGSNWGTSNGIALDRSNRWEVTASGTFQPGTVTLSLNTPSRVFPEGSSFNDADQLTNTTPTGTSQPTFTLYQSVVSITADETEIQEGDAVSYTLRRTGDTTDSLTVQLFVDRSGVTFDPPITGLVPVTFPATQDTVTTTLQTADDETYSPGSEGLIGASIFSDPQTPALYRSTSGTFADAVTVTDDDPPPVVTLGLSPSTIDEDGGTSMVTATLDRPSATGIDIDVSLEPGAPASLGSQNLLIIQGGNTEVVQLFDTNGNPISPVTITATDNDVDAPDVTVEVRGTVRNRGEIENPNPVTLTITDDDPGVVAIVRADPDTSPTNATRVTWNIFFSEVLDPDTVSNFDFKVDVDGAEIADEDFFVGKQEITDVFFTNEQGIFYLVTVDVRNVLDGLNGSTVTLNFDPNQGITSADGNPLVDTTPTGANDNTFVVDNVAPTPTITIPATSDRPFIATIEFDEPVTGFQESSITVGNAMLSGFTEVTQGEVWSVLVTPTATGAVTLSLTADSVQDATENGNVAAQASSTYTAPAAGTTVSGREIWSATLTAKAVGTLGRGCSDENFLESARCPSALTDDDFILDGRTHTITRLSLNNFNSFFILSPGVDIDLRGDDYTLTIDGTEFPINSIGNNGTTLNLANPPALTANQDYVLKLFRTPADDIAPTVTSIARWEPMSSPTDNDTLAWRVTFDEAVVNVDAADFAVVGTTATLAVEAVDGETGVYDITASGGDLNNLDGTVTLGFADTQDIADLADNALAVTTPTGTNDNSYVVANPPRIISIRRSIPNPSDPNDPRVRLNSDTLQTLTWQVLFNERVTNIDATDFTLTGATGATLSIGGSVSTAVNVTASGGNLSTLNGEVTLGLADTQDIEDVADNGPNNALTNTTPIGANENTYLVDNTGPTVEITDVPAASTGPFTATITFSEPVTAYGTSFSITTPRSFQASDISVSANARLSAFRNTVRDTVWTVVVTPTASGTITLSVPAGAVTDRALGDNRPGRPTANGQGNPNTASNTAPSTYTAPALPPGVEVWSGTLTVRGSGISVGCNNTISSERCSDGSVLSDDDFTYNGVDYDIVILNRVTIQAIDRFQLRFDPALPDDWDEASLAVMVDGRVLAVERTNIQDLNTSALTTQLKKSSPGFTWTAGQEVEVKLFYDDTTPPRVASIERQDPTTEATAADSLTWRVTFDEDVQNVDAADFEVAGATATLTVVEATASTVFDVTASGGDLADVNGTVTLGFASGQDMEDLAGNRLANTTPTGTNDNSYELDNPPIVMIDVPATRPNNNPFTVTITFSEPVSGFVQGDITVANGTLSAFTATTTDTIWTVLVTPTEDSDVTLDIAAGVATDATGNANTAATQATSAYEIDTTAPTVVSITRQMPTTSPTNADSLTWRVTFDEAVVNVDSADFTVTGTDATLAVQPVAGETGVFDVTASGGNLAGLNGTVTLNFTSTQNIEDRADNALAETAPTGTNNNSYEVDNTAPTVEIDVPATSNAPFTATITFSKMVNNFMESHITVNNATLSGFTESTTNPGTVWTVLVTPTADGMVTLDIAAGVAEDVAGNENMAATQATSIHTTPLMDTTALTVVSITRQMPTTSATNADSLTWRVTFSEAVMNLDSADFTVAGTTASLSVSQATGQPNAWDVTASGGNLANLNGTVMLAFAGDQNVQDEAGNALDTTTPPTPNHNNYQVDNIAPTVGISVPTASNGPFTAIITFREVVSGFGQSHITVGNGTLSSFVETTPGRTWTVLVMPTADGMVTLDIAAGVVMDEAGNENTAAPQAISTYSASAMDTTAPTVVSITRQMPTTSPTNADSLTWRVVFSEVVMNVDGTHFMVAGTTASLSVSQVTGQRNAWDVTASGGDLVSFNGTVTLAFAPGLDIQDQAGNPLATTPPPSTNDNSYEVDNVVPAVRYPALPDALVVGMPITPLMPSSMDNDIASYRYSATGLPAGLVIDEITGIISGTPFRLSVTPAMVMVTVSDHAGNSAIVPLPFPPVAADQPGVSVSPVSLSLNEGATTSYTVTLNTPPTGPVTITPTSDDTNTVNVSPNRLTFITTNWNVPQTVMVAGVENDNAINETVTIRHTVSGADYDAITAAAVQVTVNDNDTATDPVAPTEAKVVLDEVVLPNLVQQLTAETTEVITSRLNSIASGSQLGAPLTLSLEDVVADTVAAIYGQREHLKNGSLDWRQALSGRDFALPLSSLNVAQGESTGTQDDHPFSTLALWGGGNYSTYRNIIEETDVNGNGFSGMIGMDLQPIPQLVTGLALTTSQWKLDYATDATDASDGSAEEGTYNVDVTMVNPYVNWAATEQLSLWATFGYGHGQVKQDSEEDNLTTRTDRDDLTSWAGGIHFEVIPTMDPLTGQGAPFGLAFKADGATSSFLDTSVQLVRLAAEVSHSFAVENSLLTAALELGWRIRSVSDHGNLDGQQLTVADKNSNSGGAELAGSLNWRNTDGSLSATVNTRVFLGSGHHREWGIGGHLRFTSSRRNEEGLSLTLQPSFGVTATKLEQLWSLAGNSNLAIDNKKPSPRLDAQLVYAFPLGNNAILTPYTELTWEEATNVYGAGLRYGFNSSLHLDLKGVRHSNAAGNSEHRLLLQVYSDL